MRQVRTQRRVSRRQRPADEELPASTIRNRRVDTGTDDVLRHIDAVVR